MKTNRNFLGGGGAKQKTFRGGSMDVFWNCTLVPLILPSDRLTGAILEEPSTSNLIESPVYLKKEDSLTRYDKSLKRTLGEFLSHSILLNQYLLNFWRNGSQFCKFNSFWIFLKFYQEIYNTI